MAYYLGIDQSLTATGLCLLAADGSVETLETVDPEKRRGPSRLAFVKTRTEALLERRVIFVAMEGYSYNSTGRVFQLGEVGGVLQLLVHEHRVPLATVAPAALKKFATGNPSAAKEDMVTAAKAAGAKAQDDNQADAFFLAQIAHCMGTGKLPEKRSQLEVLHRLKNPKVKTVRRIRKLVKHAL